MWLTVMKQRTFRKLKSLVLYHDYLNSSNSKPRDLSISGQIHGAGEH